MHEANARCGDMHTGQHGIEPAAPAATSSLPAPSHRLCGGRRSGSTARAADGSPCRRASAATGSHTGTQPGSATSTGGNSGWRTGSCAGSASGGTGDRRACPNSNARSSHSGDHH